MKVDTRFAPSVLQSAQIWYGDKKYPVEPSPLLPVPLVFALEDPFTCAKIVLAVMSNASGGHILRDCRFRVHAERRTISILANGASVHYAPVERTKLTAEQAIKIASETREFKLGTVVTDQYGGGWQRARWTPAEI